MIKVNTYFDGNVKSLGFERKEAAFTAGVVLPGSYTFSCSRAETAPNGRSHRPR